jgi:hypothetical protein
LAFIIIQFSLIASTTKEEFDLKLTIFLFLFFYFMNSGKLIYSLAEATNQGSFLTMDQIIYNVVGFTIAATSTAAITIYAKKALQRLQLEEELI